jgi:transposase-like protein
METLPTCPQCRSYDVRLLTRTGDVDSYRCHDCQRVFHVRESPPEDTEASRAHAAETVAPKKR